MDVSEKIFLNNDKYYSVNQKNYYKNSEKKFQDTCKRVLPSLIGKKSSKVGIYNFTITLSSKNWDAAEPDLFVMSENYDYFGVIEVELTHHPLENHVLPQMKSIVYADYKENAEKMYEHLKNHNEKKFKKFSKKKFCQMVQMIDPEFITVSEKFLDNWDTELKKLGIRYIGLNEFINDMGSNAYYFKDSHPKKSFKGIKIEWLGSHFKIKGRENKILENGEKYKLKYKNKMHYVKVFRKTQKEIYLLPDLKNTIEIDKNKFFILGFEDGFLQLREVNK